MSQRVKILNIVRIPPLWDGRAAQQIVEILLRQVPRGNAS
jgi:hypothetical protein